MIAVVVAALVVGFLGGVAIGYALASRHDQARRRGGYLDLTRATVSIKYPKETSQ
jgi:hypothetical protein